jgi:serine protease
MTPVRRLHGVLGGHLMSNRSSTLIALTALFWSSTAYATPYGASVRVNSSLPGGQSPIQIATNKHGETAVLWTDDKSASFLKRYDGAGRAVVSSEQTIELAVKRIGIDEAGDVATLAFVGSNARSLVTLRNRSGQVTVPQFQVNDVNGVVEATLAMNDSGNFIVAWRQTVAGAEDVLAKVYRSNGTLIAGPIVLAQAFSHGLDAAMDEQGNGIVTWWQPRTPGATQFDVRAARIGASGVAIGSPFTVNSDVTTSASNQRVAMNRSGAFVVTWTSSWPGQQVIRAQRFTASGARIGGELQVAPGFAVAPAAAVADDGSFTIVWDSLNIVMGRSFSSNGASIETFALAELPGTNSFPTIGMDGSGNFAALWRQNINVGDNTWDVYLRRFLPSGMAAASLANGQLVSGLAGVRGSWRFYKITVPAGPTTLDASVFNGTGDADLYVRWGALPSLEDWDGAPYLNGNNETARMLNYPPGDWYIGVNGFADYSGLSLRAQSY